MEFASVFMLLLELLFNPGEAKTFVNGEMVDGSVTLRHVQQFVDTQQLFALTASSVCACRVTALYLEVIIILGVLFVLLGCFLSWTWGRY